MRRFLPYLVFQLTLIFGLIAQVNSKNNYSGSWNDAGTWVSTQPTYTAGEVSNQSNFNLYGYVTRPGSLTFRNLGANSYVFTVIDTLVIEGDLTFQNNSVSLSVPSGGVLVVFGNFNSNNKVTISNGGTMVITGNMTFSGGQADYSNGGGGLYVNGTVTGEPDAQAIDEPIANLNGTGDNEEQELFNFVQNNGDIPLPIKLSSFSLSQESNSITLTWTTVSEDNFSHFEIQKWDVSDFVTIANVNSTGYSSGDDYYFTDKAPVLGNNIYRLKSIDFDGYEEIFDAKSILFQPGDVDFKVYPNLGFSSQLSTDIYEKFQLDIFNLAGNRIMTTTVENRDLSKLNLMKSGHYIFRYTINGHVVNQHMIIR